MIMDEKTTTNTGLAKVAVQCPHTRARLQRVCLYLHLITIFDPHPKTLFLEHSERPLYMETQQRNRLLIWLGILIAIVIIAFLCLDKYVDDVFDLHAQ